MPVKIGALIVILAGYAWGSYALIENRFFSGMVRIQTDRATRLSRAAPIAGCGTPLCGSAADLSGHAVLPGFALGPPANPPAHGRPGHSHTSGRQDLAGGVGRLNRDYTKRVRYRLLPGVW